jgi:hypothetical protein
VSARSALFAAAIALALVLGFALGRMGDDADRVTVTRTVETERDVLPNHLNRAWVPEEILGAARPRVEFSGAWRLGGEPALVAVAWHGEGDKTSSSDSAIEIWHEEADGWTRLFDRRRPGWVAFDVQEGDVTQDGISELLVTEGRGSGYCGPRSLLSVQGGRLHELFGRSYCERSPSLVDGMLIVAEPIGDCPHVPGNVHCYGGHRNHVLAWDGLRRVVDNVSIHCKAALRAERLCRRVP